MSWGAEAAGWLATKYGIMQQQADTAAAAQQSMAGLNSAQAQRTIQMTPAEVAEQQARASLMGTAAAFAPRRAQRDLDKIDVDILNTNATGLANALNDFSAPPPGSPLGRHLRQFPGIGQRFTFERPPGHRKGLARVPGKGDGTKDTVPAMLAPGEAVLNKSAAEGMGRGLIAALNKLGAEKMGMV